MLVLITIENCTIVHLSFDMYLGVGMKVADCVALFSLDQPATVPVDTHVWQIARRDYDHDRDPGQDLKGGRLSAARSLTPTVYESVGDVFRARFGAAAGWAHSVLFAAELSEFRQKLPIELQRYDSILLYR